MLANAGKLGRAEQIAWAPLPRDWTLVTDSAEPRDQLRRLAEAGARIHVATDRDA